MVGPEVFPSRSKEAIVWLDLTCLPIHAGWPLPQGAVLRPTCKPTCCCPSPCRPRWPTVFRVLAEPVHLA